MARSEDPKPGRWILPIVVIGMIGFTYFFVQSLEESGATEATPATSVPVQTTTTSAAIGPGATSTSTTLRSSTEQYIQNLLTKQTEADDLALELIRANEAWEKREASYAETEQAFEDFVDDAAAFAESVRVMPGPPPGFPDAAEQHANLVAAAGKMEAAAVEALEGLRAPDTGQLRRAAVEDYLAAVDEFNDAANTAIAVLGG
jgi:hypothetical protein